jgi:outer membrane protein TolC
VVARTGKESIPTAPLDVAVGIPADLLRRRPDVRRAERQAAAQSAQIGVAEAEFYPLIFLNGNFGYSAEFFHRLFRPSAFQGSFGPNVQWNILNYGRILNNVRAQDAQFQALIAAYQNTVLTAGQEVENGLVSFLKSQEQVKSLEESVRAAESAVKIALAQYEGGTIIFTTLALLQQNLVTQQNLLAQAQGNIALGLIQVYRALGGGWEIRLSGCEPSVPLLHGPVDAPPEPLRPPQVMPEAPAARVAPAAPAVPAPQLGDVPPASHLPANPSRARLGVPHG